MSQPTPPTLQRMNRRTFLQLSALTASSSTLLFQKAEAHTPKKIPTQARIVIAGAGAAGLTAANQLAQRLEGATITLVDARQAHYYQPGFTLVAAGIKPASYVQSRTAQYVPKNVNLINEAVAEFDPEAHHITTQSGKNCLMII